VLLGFVMVTTAMIGAGWALAVSFQARSDTRSVVGLKAGPDEGSWTGPLTGGIASQWIVVTPSQPPIFSTVVEKTPAPATFQLASLSVPDKAEISDATPDDLVTTGSIGVPSATVVPPPKSVATIRFLAPAKTMPSIKPATAEIARENSAANPAKLDEAQPAPRPKLAALTPMDGVTKPAAEAYPPRTAIYDITAKLVYLPNGERLEAHSGYGPYMDDPRHVRIKNRGATPPNIYTLKMREALFHGVAAIRLLPVNEKEMFNRDGILAHSYLLGPSGQSHGCVSFKNYPRFLRAFQRGEIERIVVVPRLAKPPTFATTPKTPSAAGPNAAPTS
jgi:hypothetical protein